MKQNLTIIFLFCTVLCFSQTREEQLRYKAAFDEMLAMIKGEKRYDFKRAVFLVENVHYKNTLDYQQFCKDIDVIVVKLRALMRQQPPELQVRTLGNWATWVYMTSPIAENNFQPFSYDFDDFLCKKSITSKFVTKLMKSKKGNCHSLPLFYKIVTNELGCEAFLALAPHHIYVKHRDEAGKWRNLELTNGGFSRDVYIMETMKIDVEQVRNGLYMKPLNQNEDIAFCITDLIDVYKHHYRQYDIFTLSMVETVLAYLPDFSSLQLLKADCLVDMRKAEIKSKTPDIQLIKNYKKQETEIIDKLSLKGYKQLPSAEEYIKWVEQARIEFEANNKNN